MHVPRTKTRIYVCTALNAMKLLVWFAWVNVIKTIECRIFSSAADILRPLLENNVYTPKQCMVDALKKKERLRDKRSVVLKKIKRLELEVNLIRCELKALIDRDADSLVQNLRSLQEEQLEDIDIEEDDLDKHLDRLRNFKVSCSDLTSDDCHVSLFCTAS